MYCYTYIFFGKASFIWLFSIIIPLWYIWCASLSSLIHNSLPYLPNLYLSLYMFFWILLFLHVSFLGEKCNFRGVIFCFCFRFLVYYGSVLYYCYDDAISFLLLYIILLCRLGYPLFQVIYHLQRET